jgi:polyvinyl alcohol dehydrogenase (cytochrome)
MVRQAKSSIRSSCRFFGLVASFSLFATILTAATGEEVFKQRCAGCHDQEDNSRIPPRSALQKMPAKRILKVLDFGVMMQIAYPMNRQEREAVAKFLGTDAPETVLPPEAFCRNQPVAINDGSKFIWSGWDIKHNNSRFAPADVAGLSISQVRNLKLKWALGYDGDVNAFALPAFFDGQLFVGSARGTVHALRAESGCIQWTFDADGPVRHSMIVVPNGSGHLVLFGDTIGWYYALDAQTGKLIWKTRADDTDGARLTGTAAVHDGVVYVPVASWEQDHSLGATNPYVCCTFRGSLVALRIADGKQIWKSYTIPEKPTVQGKTASGKLRMGPSGVSIWSPPVFDTKRNLIYVTASNNYSGPASKTSDAVLALDAADGKIVWASQTYLNDIWPEDIGGPNFDFGAGPILLTTPEGRDLIVAGNKGALVEAFDPDNKGQMLWETRVGRGGDTGGIQWGMSYDGKYIYAAVSDVKTKRVTDATGKSTRIFDPEEGGGLTALRPSDGSKVWHVRPPDCGTLPGCSPAQSAALTSIPGVVFSGTLGGMLLAHSTENGELLWQYNTARDYTTVDGVKGKGGAIDGPGPMVIKGMVFVNSGYGRFGGLPGNVLLAFEPEK